MYLALPNKRPYFSLINAFVKVLPQAPVPLETGQQIKLYVGTLETLARVKVLGDNQLQPGVEGYIQLELESPAHFSFKDRFILRHSELQETLGGGQFIEEGIPVRGASLRLVGARRLQHLFPFEKPESYLDLEQLKAKFTSDLSEFSLVAAADRTFWTPAQFSEQGLVKHPDLIDLGDFIMAPQQFQKVQDYLRATVKEFHHANPLLPGPGKETLRTMTGVPPRLFDLILKKITELQEVRGFISTIEHQVVLSSEEEKEIRKLIEAISQEPYEPPTLSALLEQGFSKDVIFAGAHLKLLIGLPNEHWTSPQIIQEIIDILFSEKEFQGDFELSTFRDRLSTSRKFALVFLEYFDAQGITKRKGDVRTLGKRP
jgi:selenocysteine-specific elongation factor